MVELVSPNNVNRSAMNLVHLPHLYFSKKNSFRLRASRHDVTHVKVEPEINVIL